jgi:hypothetical protein
LCSFATCSSAVAASGESVKFDELGWRGSDEADPAPDQLARSGLLGFGHAPP